MKQWNPKTIKLCLIPGAETFALEAFMGKHVRMPLSMGETLAESTQSGTYSVFSKAPERCC